MWLDISLSPYMALCVVEPFSDKSFKKFFCTLYKSIFDSCLFTIIVFYFKLCSRQRLHLVPELKWHVFAAQSKV